MNKFIVYTPDFEAETTCVFDTVEEVNSHVLNFYKPGEKWCIIKPGEPIPPRVYSNIGEITRVMDKLEFDKDKFFVYLEAHPEMTLLEAARIKCSPTLFRLIAEEFGVENRLYQTRDGKVWREPKPNSQPHEYIERDGKTYLLKECLIQEDMEARIMSKLDQDEIKVIQEHGL